LRPCTVDDEPSEPRERLRVATHQPAKLLIALGAYVLCLQQLTASTRLIAPDWQSRASQAPTLGARFAGEVDGVAECNAVERSSFEGADMAR
jgi:hypothetical protein